MHHCSVSIPFSFCPHSIPFCLHSIFILSPFHCHPVSIPLQLLGVVFQEFLTRKEDYLRALRGFLREVIRQVRNEFNFSAFTRSLMQERQETEFTQLDPAHKVRVAWLTILWGERAWEKCLCRVSCILYSERYTTLIQASTSYPCASQHSNSCIPKECLRTLVLSTYLSILLHIYAYPCVLNIPSLHTLAYSCILRRSF